MRYLPMPTCRHTMHPISCNPPTHQTCNAVFGSDFNLLLVDSFMREADPSGGEQPPTPSGLPGQLCSTLGLALTNCVSLAAHTPSLLSPPEPPPEGRVSLNGFLTKMTAAFPSRRHNGPPNVPSSVPVIQANWRPETRVASPQHPVAPLPLATQQPSTTAAVTAAAAAASTG